MDSRSQSSGITYEQLMAEIDKYQPRYDRFNKEQIAFLKKCRTKGMSWHSTALLWNKFWPPIHEETLRRRYVKEIGE